MSRCSLQTVAKFRTLSRRLNSLTYESTFNQLLHRRTPTLSGFFLHRRSLSTFASAATNNNNNQKISLDFLPSPARIVASTSQGYITCVTTEPHRLHRYYVVKPATKQFSPLPNPKTKHFTRHPVGMIVLRSHPLRFKLVRLSNSTHSHRNNNELRCEVFDSERWSWKKQRQLDIDHNVQLPLLGDEEEYLEPEPPVAAGGSLHWLTSRNRVSAFCGDTDEAWECFPLPREIREKGRYEGAMQLAEYEGKLGAMFTGWESGVMELWVLERSCGGGEKRWEERLRLDLKERVAVRVLGFCDADTVVLERRDGGVAVWEFRVGGRVTVVVEGLRCTSSGLDGFFVVRSDLERTEFGRPDGKRDVGFERKRRRRKVDSCLVYRDDACLS
ncbi:unnamed protein product [Linum tenue]|uniref:F-box associated beta-propeller type 3 domain-containing protein n=1 Tax=Linum tenue TaxID=586396 RepID=A0AAV0S7W4_9ROSI|nr:unnamed protein product [Linum tenue]